MSEIIPEVSEFDLESMENQFGKKWSEFSDEEKVASVQAAIDFGGLDVALSNPTVLRFFFETGGEAKWGKPSFSR